MGRAGDVRNQELSVDKGSFDDRVVMMSPTLSTITMLYPTVQEKENKNKMLVRVVLM